MLLPKSIKLPYIIGLLVFGWLTLTTDQAFAKMCSSPLVLVETLENEKNVSKIYRPVNPELCPKDYFKIVGSKTEGYVQRQHELKLAELQVETLWLLEKADQTELPEINFSSYVGDTTIENTTSSSTGAITNTNDNDATGGAATTGAITNSATGGAATTGAITNTNSATGGTGGTATTGAITNTNTANGGAGGAGGAGGTATNTNTNTATNTNTNTNTNTSTSGP